MRAFFTRHRLLLFFALAYALSWYPWILALAQRRTTGPNPLGPLIAGIIVTAAVYGRAGLREFLSRIVRWRVGFRWYAVAFLGPCLLLLLAVALTICFASPTQAISLTTERMRELPDRFLFTLLFVGLGEEPGWRGFALPLLQAKRPPLKASLILAPVWALWHLPLMGTEFPWQIVPAFLLSICGGILLLTWLFNGTNGSVLATMLFHATINTIGAGLIFPLFSGGTLVLLWWIYGALCLGAGFCALHFSAKRNAPAVCLVMRAVA